MDTSVLEECVVSIFRVKFSGESVTRLNELDDMKGG